MEILKNPRLNKGLAFSIEERKLLNIHGLLPPCIRNLCEQEELVLLNLKNIQNNLDKYIYMMNLLDSNERLFYKVLSSNVEYVMPFVYTPTIGEACLNYSRIFAQPKGMYITINDRNHINKVLVNWPIDQIKVVLVTDGERILGLGDLGAHGMGIPVGKLALYTALGGVDPQYCLPICLDVGTNNQKLLTDSAYIGLKQMRTRDTEYDEFIDEFMQSVKNIFGSTCLIHFEDFASDNAFRLLKRYQNEYCTYNCDSQGTGAVALAGLYTAIKRVICKKFNEINYLFYGYEESYFEAAIGTARLIYVSLRQQGLSDEEAKDKIWLVDSKGLVVINREEGGINSEKAQFVRKYVDAPMKSLLEIIDFVKPNALIGCAAQAKCFSSEIIKKMSEINERPIIFALSNPNNKSECTAEEAYHYSNGKAIFASGSPFETITLNEQTFHSSQCNNCYIFPAIGMACASLNIKHITDEFFLIAAEALSNLVDDSELKMGRVLPNLNRIKQVSMAISIAIGEFALSKNLCAINSRPQNVLDYLQNLFYSPSY